MRAVRSDPTTTALGVLAAVVVGGLAAVASSHVAPGREGTTAVAAAGLLGAFLVLGRRDLAQPHIAMPVVFYAGVLVAQLKLLTNYETPWSDTTTFLVLVGPLLFALGAGALAHGRRRPDRPVPISGLDGGRLRACALGLLALGMAGTAWKAQLSGGIPILAENIDELRSAGGVDIPFYVTFLTDCLYLSAWLSALRFARRRSAGDAALALAGLVGVSFNASRNTLLLALMVPLVFAYAAGAFRALRPRTIAAIAGAAIVVLAVSSGLFFLRTSQHQESAFEAYFYGDVVEAAAPAVRPLLPLYIGFATPLETLNRVTAAYPVSSAIDDGTFSAPGIPPVVSPFGRRESFYEVTGTLSRPYYFNVATYQGPLYADGGATLVLVVSLLLGVLFGAVRRVVMRRVTIVALALSAYLTYVAVFLFYENLLGFYTLSVLWDLGVLAVVLGYCGGGSVLGARAVAPR